MQILNATFSFSGWSGEARNPGIFKNLNVMSIPASGVGVSTWGLTRKHPAGIRHSEAQAGKLPQRVAKYPSMVMKTALFLYKPKSVGSLDRGQISATTMPVYAMSSHLNLTRRSILSPGLEWLVSDLREKSLISGKNTSQRGK